MEQSIPNANSSRGNSMGMNITISVLIFFTILAIWWNYTNNELINTNNELIHNNTKSIRRLGNKLNNRNQ